MRSRECWVLAASVEGFNQVMSSKLTTTRIRSESPSSASKKWGIRLAGNTRSSSTSKIVTMSSKSSYFDPYQDFYYSRNNQNKLIQNIVFEYMEDNLENMIQEKSTNMLNFSEFEVKLFIFQILKGLEYIHAKSNIKLSRYRSPRPKT